MVLRPIRHRNTVPQAFVLASGHGRQTPTLIDVNADAGITSDVVAETAAVRLNAIDPAGNGDRNTRTVLVLQTCGANPADGIEGTKDLLADLEVDAALHV